LKYKISTLSTLSFDLNSTSKTYPNVEQDSARTNQHSTRLAKKMTIDKREQEEDKPRARLI